MNVFTIRLKGAETIGVAWNVEQARQVVNTCIGCLYREMNENDFEIENIVPETFPENFNLHYGGSSPDGTRTHNHQIRNLMLYPLSYWRKKRKREGRHVS